NSKTSLRSLYSMSCEEFTAVKLSVPDKYGNRKHCPYVNTGKRECKNYGCFYSQHPGVPWCFHPLVKAGKSAA
uniref:P-type domain-containing protein n=1 Tax=Apteryx owenii TaxID=8824 RepID=A0A8B9Q3X4_APTOW